MRSSVKLLVALATLSSLCQVGGHVAAAQVQPSVPELFRRMQTSKTDDEAARKLLELGDSDPAARRYLVDHLPPEIAKGPNQVPQWRDEVRLAGELKMAEAAPALAKWMSVRDSNVLSEPHPDDSPAVAALVQIGDAAIPALEKLLKRGTQTERWQAMDTLDWIGTPRAKAALRGYARNGHDRETK